VLKFTLVVDILVVGHGKDRACPVPTFVKIPYNLCSSVDICGA
jgi:hypothetical protein